MLMEYPMLIEYLLGCENAIVYALSQLDSVSINVKAHAELASGVPSYACPVAETNRLNARVDLIVRQKADITIA